MYDTYIILISCRSALWLCHCPRDSAILLSEADGLAAASLDKDKVYIKFVALNEIYNFVVEFFLTETV